MMLLILYYDIGARLSLEYYPRYWPCHERVAITLEEYNES